MLGGGLRHLLDLPVATPQLFYCCIVIECSLVVFRRKGFNSHEIRSPQVFHQEMIKYESFRQHLYLKFSVHVMVLRQFSGEIILVVPIDHCKYEQAKPLTGNDFSI